MIDALMLADLDDLDPAALKARIVAQQERYHAALRSQAAHPMSAEIRCLQPAIALCLVLRFPLRYRLPLHIERCICSTAFERIDVIDDVSGTAAVGSPIGRTRMITLEVVLSSRAAPVAAMASRPRAVRAEGRAMAMTVPRSGEGIGRRE
jgi:hypothetical protein